MIRVFPRRTSHTPTDDLAFVGDPPLFRPPEQHVRISGTFTWDVPEIKRLVLAWGAFYRNVSFGGPAFGDSAGDFVPGRFVKGGVTITSRGCSKACSYCLVPLREGRIRELKIHPGYIVQDNNLLACRRPHIEAVFEMLSQQRRAAVFAGGIDIDFLRLWHRRLFDSIKVSEIWCACDTPGALRRLAIAADILAGIPIHKKRCYVLIGFEDEWIGAAEKRLEEVYRLGFLPFAQLYRSTTPKTYSRDWLALSRKWSRPAAYRSTTTEAPR